MESFNTIHPTGQTEIFLKEEADGYYERNRQKLSMARTDWFEVDLLTQWLSPLSPPVRSILEIGCGNGAKLANLCENLGAKGRGIEPSAKAVAAGNLALNNESKDIQLQVGVASSLPFSRGEFDLVFFGFCLYLVDRQDLFATVAEADRVLKSGGYLAILDFDPALRTKRPYHHKPGIFSYKNQYADLFTVSGHYHSVAKQSFSHATNHFTPDVGERVALHLLYKELDAY